MRNKRRPLLESPNATRETGVWAFGKGRSWGPSHGYFCKVVIFFPSPIYFPIRFMKDALLKFLKIALLLEFIRFTFYYFWSGLYYGSFFSYAIIIIIFILNIYKANQIQMRNIKDPYLRNVRKKWWRNCCILAAKDIYILKKIEKM